ncbi:hypothetical protein ACE6H2_005551 [Prunus campanulata]
MHAGLVPISIISWRASFVPGLCPWMLFWVMSWGGTIADNFKVSQCNLYESCSGFVYGLCL